MTTDILKMSGITTLSLSVTLIVAALSVQFSDASSQLSGYAVVAVSASNDSSVTKQICARYNNKWNGSIPLLSSPQYWQPLSLPRGRNDPYGCHPNDSTPVSGHGALLLRRGDCTFYEKAFTASRLGANLTVVVDNNTDTLISPVPANVTTPLLDMEVVLISHQDGNWLWDQANTTDRSPIMVSLYIPRRNTAFIIPSAAVIWIIALTIIISGSLMTHSSDFFTYGLVWRNGEVPDDVINPKDTKLTKWQMAIVVTVVVAIWVGFFTLLYFFWHTMIYVVVALFALMGAYCLFVLLSPFVTLIPLMNSWRIPEFRYLDKIPILKYRPDPKFFITLTVCVFVAVWWAVVRNTSYGWILLLVLGYAVNVRILRIWGKQSKLWVIAVVMCILFFYDIFMVFITPLITGDNTSVMEKLALGGESNQIGDPTCETLPIVIRIPYFLKDDLAKSCEEYTSCLSGFMILGFGDIAIPGLLVSFCLYVDKTYHPDRKLKVYFIIAIIGYAVGLIVTFVVLVLMKTAQPALLYLVPFTLIPTLVSALAHQELKLLLFGPPVQESQKEEDEGEEKEAAEVTSMSVNGQEEEEEEEVLYSVATLENKHLLEESAKH